MIRALPDLMIKPIIEAALAEDLGRAGDVTAQACIPAGARMTAVFAARKPGVLAGVDCVRLAVHALDARAKVDLRLGTAADAATILDLRPDIVVLAVGGHPFVEQNEHWGAAEGLVVSSWDVVRMTGVGSSTSMNLCRWARPMAPSSAVTRHT